MATHANYMGLRMETNESVSTNGGDQTKGERDRPLVRRLALDDITVDETVQARAQMMSEFAIDDYAEAMRQGDVFPPLIVFQEGDIYVLADGFTRHAAAKCAELTEIDCLVHAGGLRDAKLFAVGANATHGHPRSAADKRCAVRKLLKDDEWSIWSDREIARHCHVGHQLVAEQRKLTGRAASDRKFRNKHGSVGKMKTGGIGKASTHKSRRASGLEDLSGSLPPSTDKDDTEVTPHTANGIETAAAAVSVIDDKADGGELSQVYADQHVGSDEALTMVAEFARFVIAHIHDEGKNIMVTITEDDADLFRNLRNRAEFAIRTEPVAHGELSH